MDEVLERKKIFIKISGFWPEECERYPIYSRLKMYCTYSVNICTCILVAVGISMVATANNMPENKILWLLSETKKFEKIRKENVEEQKIAEFWQTCRSRIGIYLVRGYCLLMFGYFIVVFFLSDKILPLKLIFKPNSVHSPWYEVIYTVELVIFSIVTCTMLSSDIFFTVFICQLCEELQLIKSLVETSEEGDTKRVMLIIRRHAGILEYGEKVCEILSLAFFSQYSFTSIIVCFATFTALTEQNSAMVNKSLGTNIVSILTLLIICIAGEIVSTTSEDVANAITQSNLIFYSGESNNLISLKNIGFMLLRAQKPLRLSVGTFGMINLRFFSSTMKMTYSFMTVLRTMYV